MLNSLKHIFIEKVILPIGDLFFRSNFINRLNFWRQFDKYTEQELIEYQEEKLKNQLIYAIENLDLYKDISVNDTKSAKELLSRFPVLTKEYLRNNPDDLVIKTNKKTTKIYSSGSTGKSTAVFMDIDDLASLQALSFHLWELCGYKFGSKVIQTGISPKRTFLKKIKDIFFTTYYVSAFTLSEKELNRICKKLSKNNRYIVIGYPSSINIIALHALKNNFQINISTVIGLGDSLFSHYKKNIEKAFNCKIFETYGSSEGFQVGFQTDLDYMYIFTPQVYLELLDDNDKPVKDGEIGHVVLTRLDNKHMPLIRYKLGDLAIKLPKHKYPKERKYNFPLLEKVIGRNTDVVVLRDGQKMVVHSFTGIFEYIDAIKQFKIVQKNNEGIVVEYIPSNSFNSNTLELVKAKLQEHILDPSFVIEFKEVIEIKSSKSGKPQIIESFL